MSYNVIWRLIYFLILFLPLDHLDDECWRKQLDRTKVYKLDNNLYKVDVEISIDLLKYKKYTI